jgi:DNA-directed RNA polymerase subunit M/transcription elongation factor TFIIS
MMWPQFKELPVAKQISLISALEVKCFHAAVTTLGYQCLTSKFIVAYDDSVLSKNPRAIEFLIANYEKISANIPDSELVQNYHDTMTTNIERRRNSRVEKVYSRKHVCYNCKSPMEIQGERITRSGDEATSIILFCSKCDIKKTI